MSVLYSKLRLTVPSALDGEDATITNSGGNSRTVEMSSPITDIMLSGMEKYRVQAGVTDEDVLLGYGQIKKVEANIRNILKKLPYDYSGGSAVVLNNEIHILGGSSGRTNHYKWNGTSWVFVSTLPYEYYDCHTAVVLNNEIHILGSAQASNHKKHYKWNGTSWVSVSTLPYEFQRSSAVVLNNEIHILSSGYFNANNYPHALKHYKWNGSSWTSVSTLPYQSYPGSVVVLNNEIHILGGANIGSDNIRHYKWNGSSWTSVSTLPYEYNSRSQAIVLNNEIHILGTGSNTTNTTKHYKWNGSSWTSVSTLPYDLYGGSVVVWNSGVNEIVLLGNYAVDYETYDAQWDGTSWTVGED